MSKARFIVWKDCSEPYPRAGLWYMASQGKLWEAWADTAEASERGPRALFDHDFRMRVIARTRRNMQEQNRQD